ncbi:MAG TPA: hypothetical protein DHV36_02805 [Desulfobacteraceae bacterium]|nr:hypothetical protein [Desulfobacteraceae bacterium]
MIVSYAGRSICVPVTFIILSSSLSPVKDALIYEIILDLKLRNIAFHFSMPIIRLTNTDPCLFSEKKIHQMPGGGYRRHAWI